MIEISSLGLSLIDIKNQATVVEAGVNPTPPPDAITSVTSVSTPKVAVPAVSTLALNGDLLVSATLPPNIGTTVVTSEVAEVQTYVVNNGNTSTAPEILSLGELFSISIPVGTTKEQVRDLIYDQLILVGTIDNVIKISTDTINVIFNILHTDYPTRFESISAYNVLPTTITTEVADLQPNPSQRQSITILTDNSQTALDEVLTITDNTQGGQSVSITIPGLSTKANIRDLIIASNMEGTMPYISSVTSGGADSVVIEFNTDDISINYLDITVDVSHPEATPVQTVVSLTVDTKRETVLQDEQITELGLVNGSNNLLLIRHVLVTPISKASNTSLDITWRITPIGSVVIP